VTQPSVTQPSVTQPAPPASTYRLQLSERFPFAAAAQAADYLAALGASHVYLSPILQAAPGSTHGYDVVDHSRVSAALGGEDAFRAMVTEFRRYRLGVVVDIVPNHMGIDAPEAANHQFWSVLRDGQGSEFAHWFDIDWTAGGGRLLLPVLGGPVPDCLDDLTVDPAGLRESDAAGGTGGEPVLRYGGHVLPLRPGTATLPLPDLLAAQHYELADWHRAAAELNWRRFFDITTLIGVQVQLPDVFAATHEVVLRLAAEGLIDGLRIDHPDGLADPRGYLRRLAADAPGAWIVTEKILTGDERLPADWAPACAGTTGYDALRMVDGLFTDGAGADPLTRAYTGFTGGPAEFAPVEAAAKRQVAQTSLAAEVARLGRVAERSGEPALAALDEVGRRALLAELTCAVGVYRAYVVPGEPPSDAATAQLEAADDAARARLPHDRHEALDELTALLLDPLSGYAGTGDAADEDIREDVARAELAVRFQQTCGPVTAKGVEDTAFYRWSRLTSLNEVGGQPGALGVAPDRFHAFAARLAAGWPATMTTLSTHDTKRGEDVRARLAVLAERPAQWAAAVAGWHDQAVALAGPGGLPEPDTEYLMWQTLVGAWPISAERLTRYLAKAIHEAKTRTSWTSPDAAYDDAVLDLARTVLADPELTDHTRAGSVAGFAAAIAADARVNSLGAKLVQLTMPGVPDVYQLCELGSFTLVDPDNRDPADFGPARALLAALDDPSGNPDPVRVGTGPDWADLNPAKLLITSRALRLRRDHPAWFAGDYRPLAAVGPAAAHAVAFARAGHVITVATRLPATLRRDGGWRGTTLDLPAGPWHDALTGAEYPAGPVELARVTARWPVALLVAEGSDA
jgi:(1->4)-alpha-D-glucan 1-alpha-D-glucosylmutase